MTEEHFLTPEQVNELIKLNIKVPKTLFKWSTKYSLKPELMFSVESEFDILYDIPAPMTSELLLELPGFQLIKHRLRKEYSMMLQDFQSRTSNISFRDLVFEKYKENYEKK